MRVGEGGGGRDYIMNKELTEESPLADIVTKSSLGQKVAMTKVSS